MKLLHFFTSIITINKELKDIIISLGPSIKVKPTAKYIAFIHKKNFVDIVVYKSNITISLNMKKGTLNDPKKIARDVSNMVMGEMEIMKLKKMSLPKKIIANKNRKKDKNNI
jgi:predicted transport protein